MRVAFSGEFILSCPVTAMGNSPIREIRKRGNIPLVLQEDVVVELTRADMLESWRSTCALGAKKADDMIKSAAGRISSALDDEDSCDVGALAVDVTTFFLLAVRQKGMDVTQAARFCTLAWHEAAEEHLSIARF